MDTPGTVRSLGRRFAAITVLLAALPAAALAHGPIHEQIVAVTARIQRDPRNAALYVERGDLHRQHRDWKAALADFDRAAKLNPRFETLDFCRGLVWFDAEKFPLALAALERFVTAHPRHAAGRVARARTLVKLGKPQAAVDDYTVAIGLHPDPDSYLERAHVVVSRGPEFVDEALRGLDEGLAALGPIITLQLAAIEAEIGRRHYDAALVRVDAILEQAARKEEWLARRGDILQHAGRPEEARSAYTAALAALDLLPPQRRMVRATERLETRVRAELTRLEGSR